MGKKCDNTSSGTIFEKEGEIVLIKRFNYPEAIALPAGHLDGDSPENNARKESAEEVELIPHKLQLLWNGDIDNPCKREGGSHHQWSVFRALDWGGELKAGSDAAEAFRASTDQLNEYARITERFMKKYGVPYTEVGRLTYAIFGNPAKKQTDPEWRASLGFEPVWYWILKELKMI